MGPWEDYRIAGDLWRLLYFRRLEEIIAPQRPEEIIAPQRPEEIIAQQRPKKIIAPQRPEKIIASQRLGFNYYTTQCFLGVGDHHTILGEEEKLLIGGTSLCLLKCIAIRTGEGYHFFNLIHRAFRINFKVNMVWIRCFPDLSELTSRLVYPGIIFPRSFL